MTRQKIRNTIIKKKVFSAVIDKDKVFIPGGFTPTEIQNVYEQVADFVTIFPTDNLDMSLIKSIKVPLPRLKVIPTGGVTLTESIDWINHGSSALGKGSPLVDNKAIESEDYSQVTENTKILCSNLGVN